MWSTSVGGSGVGAGFREGGQMVLLRSVSVLAETLILGRATSAVSSLPLFLAKVHTSGAIVPRCEFDHSDRHTTFL